MKYTSDLPHDLYYLDENFSVRSLRKYQLKDILLSHNVPVKSSCTKLVLISLFKDHIEARRAEIISEYQAKIAQEQEAEAHKQLGRGHRISHKPSRYHDAAKDNDGFAIPAIPQKRHTPRFAPEDSFDEGDSSDATPSVRPLKSSIRKTPTAFKENVAPKKTVRFNMPAFNPEDSFASSDDEQHVYPSRARVPRKRSPPKETAPQQQPIEVTQVTLANPLADDDDDSDYLADSDETDDQEEYDEEEIEESEVNTLYREVALPVEKVSGYHMLTRAQKLANLKQQALVWKAKAKRAGLIFCSVYMMIAVVGLFFTTFARQENGYCESVSVDQDVSFIFSLLPSSCIPCPNHGICNHGELKCDPLYERKRPFYNVGNVLPIADECIHNSHVGKHVAKVEKKIKKQLIYLQSQAACKHIMTHPEVEPKDVPVRRVLVKDLLAEIKASLAPYFSPDIVNEIMYIALASALEDPYAHYWEIDHEKYIGTSRANLSLGCQLKRLYVKTPIAIKLYVLLFFSALSAVFAVSKDYRKTRRINKKVDGLVVKIVAALKEQYDNHTKDPKKFANPALAVSQIRSSILDVNDHSMIGDWQRAVVRIGEHPHIRKSFEEVRGDPVEYWELTP